MMINKQKMTHHAVGLELAAAELMKTLLPHTLEDEELEVKMIDTYLARVEKHLKKLRKGLADLPGMVKITQDLRYLACKIDAGRGASFSISGDVVHLFEGIRLDAGLVVAPFKARYPDLIVLFSMRPRGVVEDDSLRMIVRPDGAAAGVRDRQISTREFERFTPEQKLKWIEQTLETFLPPEKETSEASSPARARDLKDYDRVKTQDDVREQSFDMGLPVELGIESFVAEGKPVEPPTIDLPMIQDYLRIVRREWPDLQVDLLREKRQLKIFVHPRGLGVTRHLETTVDLESLAHRTSEMQILRFVTILKSLIEGYTRPRSQLGIGLQTLDLIVRPYKALFRSLSLDIYREEGPSLTIDIHKGGEAEVVSFKMPWGVFDMMDQEMKIRRLDYYLQKALGVVDEEEETEEDESDE